MMKNEITRNRQGTNIVGVPRAATITTRAQSAVGKLKEKMIKERLVDVGYHDYIARRLKEVCNKLYSKFGKTTNEEEENMCAIGKCLINEALLCNETKTNNKLMSLINMTDELMGRCRWIECRPDRSTSALTRANQQLAGIKQAWKMFEAKVRKTNGWRCGQLTPGINQVWKMFDAKGRKTNGWRCRQLTPNQDEEYQRLVKRTAAVHAFIEDNCEQILFEHENKTDSRKNDIKAGDDEEDKTVKTSNKWNREATNAAFDGQQEQDYNYCPEYEYDPVTEEAFDDFCCIDEYQDPEQLERTCNEQDGYGDMYGNEDQRQLEYAGDQQSCNRDTYFENESEMPQPTIEMEDSTTGQTFCPHKALLDRILKDEESAGQTTCQHKAYLDRWLMDEEWQPTWNNRRYATRGTAWQTICRKPWVQQTRRMDRDDRYTPENLAKIRVDRDFAGILVDKIRLTKAIADSGCTSTIVIPGTPIKNVRPTTNPITLVDAKGGKLVTTHEGEIDIPGLPIEARRAHICPDLAHSSLVAVKQLADAGCKIIYDKEEVRVMYQGKVVWRGGREVSTGLWVLPLCPDNPEELQISVPEMDRCSQHTRNECNTNDKPAERAGQ